MNNIPNILSIAGSDPSGGAGVQADLKVISALGGYGMAAVTALTAQNTMGVRSVVHVPARFMRDQIETVFDDIDVSAVKIGMLGNAEIMEEIACCLEQYQPENIVLDPVMVATSGDSLIDMDAIDCLKKRLIPLADIITPNIPEAEKLMRKSVIDMEMFAQNLLDLGARSVLLKGGHLKGDVMRDVFADQDGVETFEAPRVETDNTHGTGCSLSSAIAVYLGHGLSMREACKKAKDYVTCALGWADALSVGGGHGPLHHTYCLTQKERST